MSRLLKNLACVVNTHPTQEKLLVWNDSVSARALLDKAAVMGTPWVNLRVITPLGLAQDTIARSSPPSDLVIEQDVASQTEGLLLLEEILGEDNPKFAFLKRVPLSPGMLNCVYSSILNLRRAGLTSEDLDPKQFETVEKGRAIVSLLREYEKALKARDLLDEADVYRVAIKTLKNPPEGVSLHENRVYLLPDPYPIGHGLPREFLMTLPEDHIQALFQDPVYGLEPPSTYWCPSFIDYAQGTDASAEIATSQEPVFAVSSDTERLPWLNAVEDSPPPVGDESISLFQASGMYNEVREVLRRIASSDAPLDEVELVTTDIQAYTPIIREICESLDIPCSFARGIPSDRTKPGRALALYLEWVSGGFPVRPLWQGIAEGLISVPDSGEHSGLALARLLRSSGIGWGRERYDLVLTAKLKEVEERLAEPGMEEDEDEVRTASKETLKKRQERLVILQRMSKDLFAITPKPSADSTVSLADLCQGAASFLQKYVVTTDEIDAAALTALVEALDEVTSLSGARYPVPEAVERIELLVGDAWVNRSPAKPGAIHVTDIPGAGWSERSHTFILGLDGDRFPGGSLSDPLLLDTERENLSQELELSIERLQTNRYRLAQAVAKMRGRLTVSFSNFDAARDRYSFPSPAVLQLDRLRTGDPNLDYSALIKDIGPPIGCVPLGTTRCVDQNDFWMKRLVLPDGRLADARRSILRLYPGLAAGLLAEDSRQDADSLTAYDGWIGTDPSLDPRTEPSLIVSASRLEMLAGCPHRYYFRYVLNIEPPEDIVYDPMRWLDPMQRGELLHAVFCDFLTDLRKQGEARPLPKHYSLLQQILESHIDKWKDAVPPPSDQVFQFEKEGLFRSVDMFFRSETKTPSPGIPKYFEVAFGFGDVPAGFPGLSDPVELPTDSGQKVRVRGRIDRIDDLGNNTYAIWDYKTGSSYGYDELGYFKKGRQIQHALYAEAAEILLRETGLDPNARVTLSGYYFPTERGEGVRIERSHYMRTKLPALLDALLDIIKTGSFVPGSDSGYCFFCDYAPACGGEGAVLRMKEKRGRLCTPELSTLERVEQYE